MAPQQDLRILCFGASITAGHYHFGLKHHPYAIRLKSRLQETLPSHTITIEIDGLSGDQVINGHYMSRLQRRLNDNNNGSNNKKYDWLILQGGGNDLGSGTDPDPIFLELQKLWKMGLSGGMRVMALTVTETNTEDSQTKARYQKLNDMVRGHEEQGFFVADVCKRIPYWSMDPELRRKVWDDGLHFKPLGYDMFGDAIADRLLEIVQDISPKEDPVEKHKL
ncbi:MAG: hypothetical protein Q9183_005949 [Haloplaca sp. 2 TL-2023]